MSDRPARVVHARPPERRPAPRRAALPLGGPASPPGATLSSSAAIDAFLGLLHAWRLAPARGWRMLTGLGGRPGSLTPDQVGRVQQLLAIDAGLRPIYGSAVGDWMVTGSEAPGLAGSAPVDYLTRAGTPGYAALARQVDQWAGQ